MLSEPQVPDVAVLMCTQAQVPITYLRPDQVEAWGRDPLVPFEERSDSPVYVQSNCNAISGRDLIVHHIMQFRDLKVRSYGRCVGRPFRVRSFLLQSCQGGCL
jgi:alpha-1,3-fucosyltransferase 10